MRILLALLLLALIGAQAKDKGRELYDRNGPDPWELKIREVGAVLKRR